MYNLLISGSDEAWEGRRYVIDRSRFGEFTVEGLKTRFESLEGGSLEELLSLPSLFAYERGIDKPARIGNVTHIFQSIDRQLRFEYRINDNIPPIPRDRLTELAWELDIGRYEMNRTHWAVKDVNLTDVLIDARLIDSHLNLSSEATVRSPLQRDSISASPTVFAIPEGHQDPRLVAVMMPFDAAFTNVYRAIECACTSVGLTAQRADDIWEASTVIQDVFDLIYRSTVVVVDLSGRNANVMYETGIAHTLGRPVIPIANSVSSLPFDLAHHRTLEYLPNTEGLREMEQKLQRRLRTVTAQTSLDDGPSRDIR